MNDDIFGVVWFLGVFVVVVSCVVWLVEKLIQKRSV